VLELAEKIVEAEDGDMEREKLLPSFGSRTLLSI
jgi:hypothetical protein